MAKKLGPGGKNKRNTINRRTKKFRRDTKKLNKDVTKGKRHRGATMVKQTFGDDVTGAGGGRGRKKSKLSLEEVLSTVSTEGASAATNDSLDAKSLLNMMMIKKPDNNNNNNNQNQNQQKTASAATAASFRKDDENDENDEDEQEDNNVNSTSGFTLPTRGLNFLDSSKLDQVRTRDFEQEQHLQERLDISIKNKNKTQEQEPAVNKNRYQTRQQGEDFAFWGEQGLNLAPQIQDALHDLNFSHPTPVQEHVLPKVFAKLAGANKKDLIVSSETGSGKTLVFALPTLQHLVLTAPDVEESVSLKEKNVGEQDENEEEEEDQNERQEGEDEEINNNKNKSKNKNSKKKAEIAARRRTRDAEGSADEFLAWDSIRTLHTLILTPTRELAEQIHRVFASLAAKCDRRIANVACILGGMSLQRQQRVLNRRPHILICTPGRVWDLVGRNEGCYLGHSISRRLSFLVLDEADRLMQSGHYNDLHMILDRIRCEVLPSGLLVGGTASASVSSSKNKKKKNINRKVTLKPMIGPDGSYNPDFDQAVDDNDLEIDDDDDENEDEDEEEEYQEDETTKQNRRALEMSGEGALVAGSWDPIRNCFIAAGSTSSSSSSKKNNNKVEKKSKKQQRKEAWITNKKNKKILKRQKQQQKFLDEQEEEEDEDEDEEDQEHQAEDDEEEEDHFVGETGEDEDLELEDIDEDEEDADFDEDAWDRQQEQNRLERQRKGENLDEDDEDEQEDEVFDEEGENDFEDEDELEEDDEDDFEDEEDGEKESKNNNNNAKNPYQQFQQKDFMRPMKTPPPPPTNHRPITIVTSATLTLQTNFSHRNFKSKHFLSTDTVNTLGRVLHDLGIKERYCDVFNMTLIHQEKQKLLKQQKQQNDQSESSSNPGVVATLHEAYTRCASGSKDLNLIYFLRCCAGKNERVIVFVNAISMLRRLSSILSILGFRVGRLHSSMQQRSRLGFIDKFRSGENNVLIATDIASRGLDVDGVQYVVHYQAPRSTDAYIHRCGRTARCGGTGFSLMLVNPEEYTIFKQLLKSMNNRSISTVEVFSPETSSRQMKELHEALKYGLQIDKLEKEMAKSSKNQQWVQSHSKEADIEAEDLLDPELAQENREKGKAAKILRKRLAAMMRDIDSKSRTAGRGSFLSTPRAIGTQEAMQKLRERTKRQMYQD